MSSPALRMRLPRLRVQAQEALHRTPPKGPVSASGEYLRVEKATIKQVVSISPHLRVVASVVDGTTRLKKRVDAYATFQACVPYVTFHSKFGAVQA